MAHDTGGDPMRGLKWCRKTPAKVAQELQKAGIQVSTSTVGRLLKKLLGYSLRVNHKTVESGHKNPPKPKERDRQFKHIGDLRESFVGRGDTIISVDTKKKELIGNFKNNGHAWGKKPDLVYDHDFRSDASGRITPYGVYDIQANRGFVCVGTSAETPAFAVDSIQRWWIDEGRNRYPHRTELLILADCGGANSARSRVWKYRIQKQLCDANGLTVTVCHYPPGASKWNPIEHRLFSEITRNWAGKPLRSYRTALNYIRKTKTTTGLCVQAHFIRKTYHKGEKVSQVDLEAVRLSRPHDLPDWNYTIHPSTPNM